MNEQGVKNLAGAFILFLLTILIGGALLNLLLEWLL